MKQIVMKHIKNNWLRHATMIFSVIILPLLFLGDILSSAVEAGYKSAKDLGKYVFSKEYVEDFKDCWKEGEPGNWWQ